MATVLHRGRIHTSVGPHITAMVVEGPVVTWLGTDDAVAAHIGPADSVVDLAGALVTPAFVDAHVHATATGLALTGLELRGTRSAAQVLDRVAAFAAGGFGGLAGSGVVLASGWDESGWEESGADPDGSRDHNGSGPRLPSPGELSRAAGGRAVYLARADAHSALVSVELLDGAGLASLDGYDASGWLRGDAHEAVRTAALAQLSTGDRRAAQRACLDRAASLGIGSVHEMAGPAISGADDLAMLLGAPHNRRHDQRPDRQPDRQPDQRRDGEPAGPEVVGYWGERDGIEAALDLGAAGAGGDLFCDGAIGSHTAAFSAPYADRPIRVDPRFTAAQLADHVIGCTRAGIQAGFHAIGDAAIDTVLAGMDAAAAQLGLAAVRGARHRLEHAELVTDTRRLAASGLIASMQPGFDASWGGPDGMYARRLGERSAALNDFAALSSAGVALAFGSDAPVTPLDPWGTVRAAAYHRTSASSLSVRAAFTAHTRGGWRAARRDGDGSGVLAVGHPATYAVWDDVELVIDVPDERVSRWSTDPRAGVAGLPDIAPGRPLPSCRQTVVRGRVVYDAAPA